MTKGEKLFAGGLLGVTIVGSLAVAEAAGNIVRTSQHRQNTNVLMIAEASNQGTLSLAQRSALGNLTIGEYVETHLTNNSDIEQNAEAAEYVTAISVLMIGCIAEGAITLVLSHRNNSIGGTGGSQIEPSAPIFPIPGSYELSR
jgi:hypothetical protein